MVTLFLCVDGHCFVLLVNEVLANQSMLWQLISQIWDFSLLDRSEEEVWRRRETPRTHFSRLTRWEDSISLTGDSILAWLIDWLIWWIIVNLIPRLCVSEWFWRRWHVAGRWTAFRTRRWRSITLNAPLPAVFSSPKAPWSLPDPQGNFFSPSRQRWNCC